MTIEVMVKGDMTCYRCKDPVKVGVIICPKCADELGAVLRGEAKP